MVRLGEPERHRPLAGDQRLGPLLLLRVGAEPVHHDDLREVADDRRLVLQVVVQPEPLVRQVFPDHGHVDVGAVAAAELRRQPVAQPAGRIGAPAHLAEQVLPLPPRDAAVVPVGAGVLAALVEVLHVLAFQRLDLGLDERVHLGQQARKMFWESEIHCDLLCGQKPYSVFFQIVDSVAMASSSLISSPRPDAPTNTVVKFSNSSAIAAAVCSGSRSAP